MPNAATEPLNGFLLDTNAYYGLTSTDEIIQRKVLSTPAALLFLCDVVVLEILRRRVNTVEAEIKKSTHGKSNLPAAYAGLLRDINNITRFNIAPYDDQADAVFQEFRKLTKRPASGDCRITAIAKARGLVVVTANTKDFSLLLPDAQIADWSTEES